MEEKDLLFIGGSADGRMIKCSSPRMAIPFNVKIDIFRPESRFNSFGPMPTGRHNYEIMRITAGERHLDIMKLDGISGDDVLDMVFSHYERTK